ncbi:hypothetical protein IAI10_16265 [Clostridium sp. 19966]|nr:hypothetical protein [Clostridium sp. 19966]MDT8718222.1 hypothetical protein [Clostridium sp. 19966]
MDNNNFIVNGDTEGGMSFTNKIIESIILKDTKGKVIVLDPQFDAVDSNY